MKPKLFPVMTYLYRISRRNTRVTKQTSERLGYPLSTGRHYGVQTSHLNTVHAAGVLIKPAVILRQVAIQSYKVLYGTRSILPISPRQPENSLPSQVATNQHQINNCTDNRSLWPLYPACRHCFVSLKLSHLHPHPVSLQTKTFAEE